MTARLSAGALAVVLGLVAPVRFAMAREAELLVKVSTYRSGNRLGAHCPARIEGSGPITRMRIVWDRDQSAAADGGKGLTIEVGGLKERRALRVVGDSASFSGDYGSKTLRVLGPQTRVLCARPLPREKGVLFVGKIAGTEANLVPRVEVAVADGIGQARSDLGSEPAYSAALTHNQVGAERGQVLAALSDLEKYTADDLRDKVIESRAPAQHQQYQDYVRITLLRGGSGLIARVELIALEGWELLAWKSIGGCGESDDDVILSVQEAIAQIVRGQDDRAPTAVVRLASTTPAWVNSTFELDGCKTSDPDFDKLRFSWTGSALDPSASQLPAGHAGLPNDTHGPKVRVEVAQPGRYRYQLEVTQLVNRTSPGPSSRTSREVQVFASAPAEAGPDCYVEVGNPVVLGECPSARSGSGGALAASGVSRSWRLVAGPLDSAAADTAASAGRYRPLEAGRYVWELSISNGVRVEKDQVTHLVAKKPKATLLPRERVRAFVGETVELALHVDPDPLDPHPTMRWTLWSLIGQDRPQHPCGGEGLADGSLTATEGALLSQRNERAVFTSGRTGRFLAVACAKLRRRLGDTERTDSIGDAVTIDVVRPAIFLGVQAGAGALVASGSSNDVQGYFEPYVGVAKVDLWGSNRIGLGAHAGFAWTKDVAVAEGEDSAQNGWLTLGPNLHLAVGRRWDWHLYLGFCLSPFDRSFAGGRALGFEFGDDVSIRLWKPFGLFASLRTRWLFVDPPIASIGDRLLEAELGLGVAVTLPGP